MTLTVICGNSMIRNHFVQLLTFSIMVVVNFSVLSITFSCFFFMRLTIVKL